MFGMIYLVLSESYTSKWTTLAIPVGMDVQPTTLRASEVILKGSKTAYAH